MIEISDLLLDEEQELMLGEHPDGETDLVFWAGAEIVLQSAAVAVRLPKASVWYNRAAGWDYKGLFFSGSFTRRRDSIIPIARRVLRRILLGLDGVEGFETENKNGQQVEKDIQFRVDPKTRTIGIDIPCLLIDCENSQVSGVLPQNLSPVTLP